MDSENEAERRRQAKLRLETPLWPSESVQLPISDVKKREDDLVVKRFYESLLKKGRLNHPEDIKRLKELQDKYPND